MRKIDREVESERNRCDMEEKESRAERAIGNLGSSKRRRFGAVYAVPQTILWVQFIKPDLKKIKNKKNWFKFEPIIKKPGFF